MGHEADPAVKVKRNMILLKTEVLYHLLGMDTTISCTVLVQKVMQDLYQPYFVEFLIAPSCRLSNLPLLGNSGTGRMLHDLLETLSESYRNHMSHGQSRKPGKATPDLMFLSLCTHGPFSEL